MTTPFKHLSYLMLSGMLITAVACGSDAADDATEDNDTAVMTTDATAPTAPADGTMAGADSMPADPMTANTGNPDQDFATKASATNLAEIRAHQTAVEKAITPDVKKHAQMMLTDHKKMDADMKALAAKKGITLASEPRPDKVKMQDEMNASKQGKDWDMAYADAQVQDHKEAIAMFEDGEKAVKDADLKALITATLPKLRAHLKMMEDAKSKMK